MTAEVANGVSDVEDTLTNSQHHSGPFGSDQGLSTVTEAKNDRSALVPTVLHAWVTIDGSRFRVLMKQGVVSEIISERTAQQVRRSRSGSVLDPRQAHSHDVDAFHIRTPQEYSSSEPAFTSSPDAVS